MGHTGIVLAVSICQKLEAVPAKFAFPSEPRRDQYRVSMNHTRGRSPFGFSEERKELSLIVRISIGSTQTILSSQVSAMFA